MWKFLFYARPAANLYFYRMMLQSTFQMPLNPRRIVSLVPSQTELLYDLGLEESVVGITKFCVHPSPWRQTKMIVGGTKNIHVSKVIECNPDLVIANKEENVREQVEAIAAHCPVWLTDVGNFKEALAMMSDIGTLCNRVEKANEIIEKVTTSFNQLSPLPRAIRTTYFIWKDPWMTVGGDTFIHSMMTKTGLENIYSHTTRYPVISPGELHDKDCELILLSSEPYPFNQSHLHSLQQQFPQQKILLVDGEMFSWYGSRLLHAAAYFNTLMQQPGKPG